MNKKADRKKTAGEYHRLQFDFSKKSLELLEELQAQTDSRSRAEVVRNALSVYHWLLIKAEKGEGLQISPEDLDAILGFTFRARVSPIQP